MKKLPKYCKICGGKLYRSGFPMEMTKFNQFNGRKVHLGFSIRLYCEVLKDCGKWNQEERKSASAAGLYAHVHSIDGITKKQAYSYKEI